MNLLQILKNSASTIYAKYLKNNEIENMPIFYTGGSQTLPPPNVKQLLKQILIFYLVSFIFGGCTFALIYFLKPENVEMKNGVFVGMYPIRVGLIAGVIAFIITQIAFKINKSKLNN